MQKEYEDLDIDELRHLAGSYSNYIQEFDYVYSGTPVSIYEFYETDYLYYLELEDWISIIRYFIGFWGQLLYNFWAHFMHILCVQ